MAVSSASVEGEYEKNKELKRDDVQQIQDWLRKQPHLPKISELQIILFLHSCYYSGEATKVCIDNFYTIKAHCPEFFANRNPLTNSHEVLDLLLYVPLPKHTPEGYKVIFCKMIETNPDKYSFASQVKAFDMATVLMLHQEGTAVGYVVVTDMVDVTFSHLKKLGLLHIRKFFFYLQEAMPVRIKGLHFVNIPSFMDKILSLIKPFLKNDLINVLHLHSTDHESLYKFVPKECLPADYGGSADTVANLLKIRNKEFMAKVDFFVGDEKEVANEAKRPGKPRNEGDVFGVDGTFKKLSID